MEKVPEEDFNRVMVKIRDLRKWAYETKIDPWAVRQALITAFEMDTAAALRRGVSMKHLQMFDFLARKEAQRIIKEM